MPCNLRTWPVHVLGNVNFACAF